MVENLIDWSKVPQDPIFQLTFMQKEMLQPDHFSLMERVLERNDKLEIQQAIRKIRFDLNPHPADQLVHNVPKLEDERVPGVQHKYRETALIFPKAGQTCFAYCTFCFRWAQFIGDKTLQFATDKSQAFYRYIEKQKSLNDVLITGGDPMIMTGQKLSELIEPFLGKGFEHIKNIRIGTKVLTYWPNRLTTDKDADQILELFGKVKKTGKNLSFMAHFNHPVELSTPEVEKAISRVLNTGAVIRTQSPILEKINANAEIWIKMWNLQMKLGCIPYYMFVERDTGPRHYFELPLAKAFEVYQKAISSVSGLARTARGPSMSASPGKVVVDGIAEIEGEKVFVLNFLQARNPDWVKKPFFAKFDEKAVWLDDLAPAFGGKSFYFENNQKEKVQSPIKDSYFSLN